MVGGLEVKQEVVVQHHPLGALTDLDAQKLLGKTHLQ